MLFILYILFSILKQFILNCHHGFAYKLIFSISLMLCMILTMYWNMKIMRLSTCVIFKKFQFISRYNIKLDLIYDWVTTIIRQVNIAWRQIHNFMDQSLRNVLLFFFIIKVSSNFSFVLRDKTFHSFAQEETFIVC